MNDFFSWILADMISTISTKFRQKIQYERLEKRVMKIFSDHPIHFFIEFFDRN